MRRTFALLLIATSLVGCGQKGALTLPDAKAEAVTATPQSSPETAPPADDTERKAKEAQRSN
jgi:predicted small lipoprotein YifL